MLAEIDAGAAAAVAMLAGGWRKSNPVRSTLAAFARGRSRLGQGVFCYWVVVLVRERGQVRPGQA